MRWLLCGRLRAFCGERIAEDVHPILPQLFRDLRRAFAVDDEPLTSPLQRGSDATPSSEDRVTIAVEIARMSTFRQHGVGNLLMKLNDLSSLRDALQAFQTQRKHSRIQRRNRAEMNSRLLLSCKAITLTQTH